MIPSYWRLAAVLVLLVIVVRVTAESLRESEDPDRDWSLQRQFSRGNAKFAAGHERYRLGADSKRVGPSQRAAILALKDTDTLKFTNRRRNTEAGLSQRAEGITLSTKQKDRQIRDVHNRNVVTGLEIRAERRVRFERRDSADDLLVRTRRRMLEDQQSNSVIENHLKRIERTSAVRRREVNIRSIDAGDNRWTNNFIRLDHQRNDRLNAPLNRNSPNYRMTIRTADHDGDQDRKEQRSIMDREDTHLGDRIGLNYRSTRRHMEVKRLELNRQPASQWFDQSRQLNTDSKASGRAENHRSRRYNFERETKERENLRFSRRNQLYERQDETSARRNIFDSRRGIEERNYRSLNEEFSRDIRRFTETMKRSDRLIDRRATSVRRFEEETNVQQQSRNARPIMSIRENNERNHRRVGDRKKHLNMPENRLTSESRYERVNRRKNSSDRRQKAVIRHSRQITYPSDHPERLEELMADRRNYISNEEQDFGNDQRIVEIAKRSNILKVRHSRFERATPQLNERRESHADRNIRSVREKRQDTERNRREAQESTLRRQKRAVNNVLSMRQSNVQNDERLTETIKRLERLEDRKANNIGIERSTRQFNNRRSFTCDRSDIPAELNQDNTLNRVESEERKVFMKSRVIDSRANDYISRNSLATNEIALSDDDRTNSRNRMDRTQRRMQPVSTSRLEELLETRIDKKRNLDAEARIGSKWSWQLCQALLISAILAQFLKNRDGLDKRMRYICN